MASLFCERNRRKFVSAGYLINCGYIPSLYTPWFEPCHSGTVQKTQEWQLAGLFFSSSLQLGKGKNYVSNFKLFATKEIISTLYSVLYFSLQMLDALPLKFHYKVTNSNIHFLLYQALSETWEAKGHGQSQMSNVLVPPHPNHSSPLPTQNITGTYIHCI